MKPQSLRAAGVTIICGTLYQAAVLLAMHFLEPEFSPIRAPMSAYVLGAYGSWMTTVYFVWPAALVAALYGMFRTLGTGVARAAFGFLSVALAGMVLAGIFPMDPPAGPIFTMSGKLHALGGSVTFPAMTLGILLCSLSFRRDPQWQPLSGRAMFLAVGMLACLAVGIVSLFLLGFAAYAQRLYTVLNMTWMISVGAHLIRIGGNPHP